MYLYVYVYILGGGLVKKSVNQNTSQFAPKDVFSAPQRLTTGTWSPDPVDDEGK